MQTARQALENLGAKIVELFSFDQQGGFHKYLNVTQK
jgi:hypothetical protein